VPDNQTHFDSVGGVFARRKNTFFALKVSRKSCAANRDEKIEKRSRQPLKKQAKPTILSLFASRKSCAAEKDEKIVRGADNLSKKRARPVKPYQKGNK